MHFRNVLNKSILILKISTIFPDPHETVSPHPHQHPSSDTTSSRKLNYQIIFLISWRKSRKLHILRNEFSKNQKKILAQFKGFNDKHTRTNIWITCICMLKLLLNQKAITQFLDRFFFVSFCISSRFSRQDFLTDSMG